MNNKVKELLIKQLELLNKQSEKTNSDELTELSNSMANIANAIYRQQQIQSYSACGRTGQVKRSKEN